MKFLSHPLSLPLVITNINHFSVIKQNITIYEWLKQSVRLMADGFVIFDPDGQLLNLYGSCFIRDGYQIKVFDTSNLYISARYNPFVCVRDDGDVLKLVSAFAEGTKGNGESGDMRFAMAETSLLTALFSYVSEELPDDERNLYTVSYILKHMLPYDDALRYYNDTDYVHVIDVIFEDHAERSPHSLAAKSYEDFKHIAGNNAYSIIQSCIKRLEPFSKDAAKAYFENDELNFDSFGKDNSNKTVLFVSAGQSETFDFLASLLYTQLLDTLCHKSMKE